ncbi:MAG: beta-N-acetylhexosaminidase [Armatimonadetes bacterium]|nr:beta-N-acetylhexosaminidase [Armatimonadota bacterium]MDW8121758.1 glycoside hydrolase family 20 zincin-like fold domain-containing protein [Armatimonadota bacterium]
MVVRTRRGEGPRGKVVRLATIVAWLGIIAESAFSQAHRIGLWQWQSSSQAVHFSYNGAPILSLTAPASFFIGETRSEGRLLQLRLVGDDGGGSWTVALTDNRLSAYARHELAGWAAGSISWLWAALPVNLFQGSRSVPTASFWQGETCFGRVRISVEGLSASVRWRKTGNWFTCELSFLPGSSQLAAQLSLELPSSWLKVEERTGSSLVQSLDIVQGDPWGAVLVPSPKQIVRGRQPFRLGREVLIRYTGGDAYQKVARRLAQILRDHWDRRPQVAEGLGPDSERAILIVPEDHRDWVRSRFDALGRDRPVPRQGYLLHSDSDGVVILASDPEGARNGVRCLEQLIALTDEGGLEITPVNIRDYPELAFRGVHFVVDDHSPQLHHRLIRRVFSRLRFNAVIVQLDHLEWKSRPEIRMPWSLPQSEALALFQDAEEEGMEVIPLLPTLSHCEYLFGSLGGQPPRVNGDIAESPSSSYLYCPSYEKTYEIVFTLLSELLSLGSFRTVHLGHDEVTRDRTFGTCPRCSGIPRHQLFAYDILRLYDFLRQRGKRMMIWGDMLLRPEEASDAAHGGPPDNLWRARDIIPKDIIIVDWHYQPAPRYPSLWVFTQEGFPVIAASWRNPLNILGLARASKVSDVLGMCQTTWTGFGGNRTAPAQHPDQLSAYVTAGEAMWDPFAKRARDRWASDWTLFDRLLSWPAIPTKSGAILTVADAANFRLKLLPKVPFLSAPHRLVWKGTVVWLPHDSSGDLVAAVTGGRWIPGAPRRFSFPTSQPVEEILLVHGCAFPVASGTLVGQYQFLSPGCQSSLDLLYGHNIFALTDPRKLSDPQSDILWTAATGKGPVGLVATRVTLKNPVPLTGIELIARDEEASPFLLSATLIGGIPEEASAP